MFVGGIGYKSLQVSIWKEGKPGEIERAWSREKGAESSPCELQIRRLASLGAMLLRREVGDSLASGTVIVNGGGEGAASPSNLICRPSPPAPPPAFLKHDQLVPTLALGTYVPIDLYVSGSESQMQSHLLREVFPSLPISGDHRLALLSSRHLSPSAMTLLFYFSGIPVTPSGL